MKNYNGPAMLLTDGMLNQEYIITSMDGQVGQSYERRDIIIHELANILGR